MICQILRSFVFAVVLVTCTLTARADTITLAVSATLTPNLGTGATCIPSCTLGGDIVIDNTTGAVISENVTMSGETPVVGPFTQNFGVFLAGIFTAMQIGDSSGDNLFLIFGSPIDGSLVGYVGGALSPASFVSTPAHTPTWEVVTGSLTPVTTPEPATLLLLFSGLVGIGPLFRRRVDPPKTN